MHVCLAVTCHLHFWLSNKKTCLTNNILHTTAVTWGWNRYRNKSQHRKLTLEKKILLHDKALWWCQLLWWTWCTVEVPQWCFNACRPWRTMRANNWLTVHRCIIFCSTVARHNTDKNLSAINWRKQSNIWIYTTEKNYPSSLSLHRYSPSLPTYATVTIASSNWQAVQWQAYGPKIL